MSTDRSKSDLYETPPEVFLPLDAKYHFTLDPCCEASTAKVPKFYTVAENGLSQSWANEVVFMNPPYSQTKHWVRKAFYESRDHGALVVGLVFSWTSSAWYQDFLMPDFRDIASNKRRMFNASKIIFVRGRVNFMLGGDRVGSAMKPSTIFVFDPKHFGPPEISTMVFDMCNSKDTTRDIPAVFRAVQGVLL